VIAGESQINNQGDFAILRLLPDGPPDSTFGFHGWTVTDLGTDLEFPNCVALQTNGKIVAAGRKADAFQSDFTMVRYHPDGTVDSLFGNNGIVGTNLREEDEVTAIAIEPDGQIILAGFSSVPASGDFAVARYNENGTLDKFFWLAYITILTKPSCWVFHPKAAPVSNLDRTASTSFHCYF